MKQIFYYYESRMENRGARLDFHEVNMDTEFMLLIRYLYTLKDKTVQYLHRIRLVKIPTTSKEN